MGERLSDSDSNVRYAAAQALGALGEHAKDPAPLLGERLSDSDSDVRYAAAQVLGQIGPLAFEEIPPVLAPGEAERSLAEETRFAAHFLGGGNADVEVLLAWMVHPYANPIPAAKDGRAGATGTFVSLGQAFQQLLGRLGLGGADPQADRGLDPASRALEVFARAWPLTEGSELRLVRDELDRQISRLVRGVPWTIRDLPTLTILASSDAPHSAVVQKAMLGLVWTERAFGVAAIVLAHGLFWLVLIFVYPYSPSIQAMLFWNKWTRRIAGFGYVGFVLAWLPFFRRRLFAPFRDSLRADARLSEFHDQNYFPDSEVRRDGSDRVAPITEAIPAISGQIVLEGESGLGKSMLLRHLVRGKGIVAFLPAAQCEGGVLEAIQSRLHGPAGDAGYLQKLVYAGAIDVVIDGLNEVSAQTQARVLDFAGRYFKGNLVIATQPMEWKPPPLARRYVLRPLREDQIRAFLVSRVQLLPEESAVKGEDYQRACDDYLKGALAKSLPEATREASQRLLSNPMDLTIVALMLAQGEIPNIHELQQQQYQIMEADYTRVNVGHGFPLKAFSERVYEMRRDDIASFVEGEFPRELACMERHRMVLARRAAVEGQEERTEWSFRHDKIMEYFLVQSFLGPNNPRPMEHLSDPRFRGTYLLLAQLLPVEAAASLERQLIDHAADTKDHSVSDDFIQLLRPRKAA